MVGALVLRHCCLVYIYTSYKILSRSLPTRIMTSQDVGCFYAVAQRKFRVDALRRLAKATQAL